jgi:hypothetical protein
VLHERSNNGTRFIFLDYEIFAAQRNGRYELIWIALYVGIHDELTVIEDARLHLFRM